MLTDQGSGQDVLYLEMRGLEVQVAFAPMLAAIPGWAEAKTKTREELATAPISGLGDINAKHKGCSYGQVCTSTISPTKVGLE